MKHCCFVSYFYALNCQAQLPYYATSILKVDFSVAEKAFTVYQEYLQLYWCERSVTATSRLIVRALVFKLRCRFVHLSSWTDCLIVFVMRCW